MKAPAPTWLLIVFGLVVSVVLAQFIDGRIALLIGFIVVIVALYMRSSRIKKYIRSIGLTTDESALVKEDLRKGDHEAVTERIAQAQKQVRQGLEAQTGIDAAKLTPEIGRDISWTDIVCHAFRVIEIDKTDTVIDENYRVVASSLTKPYGYLLVESPILNMRAKLPIIHQDDFLLAASVFDEPKLAGLVESEELLVTYAPERLKRGGLAASPSHVLHYVITPRGTLETYYSADNDRHMARPEPEKIFGRFVYHGKIGVHINSEPKL